MNKTVLITGANGGIGSALAIEFAKKGFNLVLVARTIDSLTELERELSFTNQNIYSLYIDISKPDGVEKVTKWLNDKKLHVSHLVNNAGFGEFELFEKTATEYILGMLDINIIALTRLTKALLPSLIQQQSGVLNVASVAGFMSGPGKSVYFASKAYVISLSLGLREELAGRVNVSVLCPGPTKSKFWLSTPSMKKKLISQVKFMSTDRVAKIAVRDFLRKKAIITPGLINKANTVIPRLFSKQAMAKIVNVMFKLR